MADALRQIGRLIIIISLTLYREKPQLTKLTSLGRKALALYSIHVAPMHLLGGHHKNWSPTEPTRQVKKKFPDEQGQTSKNVHLPEEVTLYTPVS